MIRPATRADAPRIAAIWNAVVRDTALTFTSREKTLTEIAAMLDRAPVLVAERGGGTAGFATYGPFRPGPGYAHTREHSVHLAAQARGQGLGRALLTALEQEARQQGIHVLIAAIAGENAGGIAFHAALGYREVGRLMQVGWKFDRWHDLVLMQKTL